MKSESERIERMASPSKIIRGHVIGIVAGNVAALFTVVLTNKYVLPLLNLESKTPSIEETLGQLVKNLPKPAAAPRPGPRPPSGAGAGFGESKQ